MSILKNENGSWNTSEKLSRDFILMEFLFNKWSPDEMIGKHFTQEIFDNLKELVIVKLQPLRDRLMSPIHINCGFRPVEWELIRGRSGTSQHCLGKAADIRTTNMVEAYRLVNTMFKTGGRSKYATFIHLDNRDGYAIW